MRFLQYFIPLLFNLYSFLILARVLLSWINVSPGNPIVTFIIEATDPVLKPLRNVIPPIGMMDISPIAALILLQIVEQIVVSLFLGF
jgi:YggT family protein